MTNKQLVQQINKLKENVLLNNLSKNEYEHCVSQIIKLRKKLAYQNLCVNSRKNRDIVVDDAVNYIVFLEKLLQNTCDDVEFDIILRVVLKEYETFAELDEQNKLYKQITSTINSTKIYFQKHKNTNFDNKVNELDFLLELINNYSEPTTNKRCAEINDLNK